MKDFKNKYITLFNIVREELNKVDPIRAVLNNPNLVDEYDLENKKILTVIKNCSDYKDLSNKICEVFIESTGINFRPEIFYECAKNILEKTRNL